MKAPRFLKIIITVAVVLALLFLILMHRQWHIVAWYLDLPSPAYQVRVDKNIMIPMRDGVKLAADIYRPKKEGRYPVILTRTPYGKESKSHRYSFAGALFASQGYIYIVQDCRGKFDSEGEYYPYVNEASDGYDTIEWAGTRAWSTGRVGMYGFSYWGSTQWLPAPLGNPHLKAIVPIMTAQNIYHRWIYKSIFRINDVLVWHYENATKRSRSPKEIDWDTAVRHLPLINADDNIGTDIPMYNDWIRHPLPGPYWEKVNVDSRVAEIKAPALIIEGWYDYYLDLAVGDFNRMITKGGSREARNSMLLIGPWTHTSKSKFEAADFGPEASFMKQIKTILQWFEYWLREKKNSIYDKGPVRVFVMGANTWKNLEAWPPRNSRPVRYYLHSRGRAAGVSGDGLLNRVLPGKERHDEYIYDPVNPVPSVGGTSIYGSAEAGPADQNIVESREDVLVYTTDPLSEDMTVMGTVKLVFYASSSARDTDFVARICDVGLDGKSLNIKDAVIRARYRESLSRASYLDAGRVYRFEISIGTVCNMFKKGHRLRLHLTSSSFPEYGRNLNTGATVGLTSKTVKARQRIYHDRAHPSFMTLPCVR